MRFFIIVAAILCGVPSVLAQPFGAAQPDFRVEKQHYTNSSGEHGTTTFFYDRDGIMREAFWSLDDGSRSSRNFYQYDGRGRIVAAFRVFSDSLTSNEIFLYDSTGRLVQERFSRSDRKSGFAAYSYQNGVLVEARFRKFKGWLSGDLFPRYDSLGKRINAVLIAGGKRAALVEYEYDQDGNLAHESWDFEGTWTQTFDYRYSRVNAKTASYTSPFLRCPAGWRIKSESYDFNGSMGGPSEYRYDTNGLLEEKRFTRSDGFITRTRYWYDRQRRLIRSERELPDGKVALFTYVYESGGNLLERLSIEKDTITSYESYLYDEMGRIIRAHYFKVDGWLTGEMTYEHDPLHRISKGHFKGEDGIDARLGFRYGKYDEVLKIRWDFSSGMYQEYQFEYEPAEGLIGDRR